MLDYLEDAHQQQATHPEVPKPKQRPSPAIREPSKDKGSLESRKTSKQVRLLHEGAFDRSLKEALRNYEEYSLPSDSREEEEDDEDGLGGRQDTNTVLVRDDPREDE